MKPFTSLITYQNNDLQRRLRLILGHDLGHIVRKAPKISRPVVLSSLTQNRHRDRLAPQFPFKVPFCCEPSAAEPARISAFDPAQRSAETVAFLNGLGPVDLVGGGRYSCPDNLQDQAE